MASRALGSAHVDTPRVFDTKCTITVEQSSAHFHAHVELPEEVETQLEPGDKVLIHGDPISIPFGSREVFERTATITRAGPVMRQLTRLAAYFDLAELYEVSFNAGRIK